ncbi:MAG: hypothetical protein COA45_05865 [Zetaproteobacteria bacterium]|nr:MAG: hypothetical protein COA45_05865 [Zetaproteobacteria bacterium]
MPRKQNTLQKLVNSQTSSKPDKATSMSEFIRRMANHPDFKIAAGAVQNRAEQEFDQHKGAELQRLIMEYEDIDQQHRTSKTRLEQLDTQILNTPERIKTTSQNSDAPQKIVRFRDWQLNDQFASFYLLPAIVVILVMGASNVYANLIASGQPVFIDNYWLAISLSMLMPAASLSLKFTHHIFESYRARKIFSRSIYGTTLTALLAWSVLFAMNFDGVGGEINWDDLGESNNTGTALVWLQLIAEILIGGALSIALTDKIAKYFPDNDSENPEWRSIDAALKRHKTSHSQLSKQRGKSHEGVTALSSAREAFVSDQVSILIKQNG